MSSQRDHECAHLRDHMFNYRRGELAELDEAFFRDDLKRCPSCGRYIGRLFEMMDTAATMEADGWLEEPITPAFADDLFARIAAEVQDDTPALRETNGEDSEDAEHEEHEEHAPIAPVVRLEGRWSDDVSNAQEWDEDEPASSRQPLMLMLAAAAAILAVGAGVWWSSQEVLSPTTAPSVAQENTAPAPKERLAQGEPDQTTPETNQRALSELVRQDTAPRSVRIFASKQARWTLKGSKHYTLSLERGTVLVEFLPGPDERLEVVTPDRRVAVIGTVFYVSTPNPTSSEATHTKTADTTSKTTTPTRIGVLTGKVQVRPRTTSTSVAQHVLELGAGQEVAARGVSAIRPQLFKDTTKLVDLDRHELMLQRIREARDAAPAPAMRSILERRTAATPTPRKAAPQRKAKPNLGALRAKARRAMGDRNWRIAATHYERILGTLPNKHPEQATLRLELARLYMRHLNDRTRAVSHLRAFIQEHPSDVATPSARSQLCRLLGTKAASEPVCDSIE